MKGHGLKFGHKQEAAIAALLLKPTMSEAAAECKIGATTLWRWLQDPGFSQRYRQARSRMLESAVNRLRQAASDAATVLQNVANDSKSPASARVSAAKAILESALKAAELEDITHRLDELERTVGNDSKKTT